MAYFHAAVYLTIPQNHIYYNGVSVCDPIYDMSFNFVEYKKYSCR